MLKQSQINLTERNEQLKTFQDQVHRAALDTGMADDNCHTVCEDHLVIRNGQLVHETVCRVVCTTD